MQGRTGRCVVGVKDAGCKVAGLIGGTGGDSRGRLGRGGMRGRGEDSTLWGLRAGGNGVGSTRTVPAQERLPQRCITSLLVFRVSKVPDPSGMGWERDLNRHAFLPTTYTTLIHTAPRWWCT